MKKSRQPTPGVEELIEQYNDPEQRKKILEEYGDPEPIDGLAEVDQLFESLSVGTFVEFVLFYMGWTGTPEFTYAKNRLAIRDEFLLIKERHPKLLPYIKSPILSLFELLDDSAMLFFDALHFADQQIAEKKDAQFVEFVKIFHACSRVGKRKMVSSLSKAIPGAPRYVVTKNKVVVSIAIIFLVVLTIILAVK